MTIEDYTFITSNQLLNEWQMYCSKIARFIKKSHPTTTHKNKTDCSNEFMASSHSNTHLQFRNHPCSLSQQKQSSCATNCSLTSEVLSTNMSLKKYFHIIYIDFNSMKKHNLKRNNGKSHTLHIKQLQSVINLKITGQPNCIQHGCPANMQLIKCSP